MDANMARVICRFSVNFQYHSTRNQNAIVLLSYFKILSKAVCCVSASMMAGMVNALVCGVCVHAIIMQCV